MIAGTSKVLTTNVSKNTAKARINPNYINIYDDENTRPPKEIIMKLRIVVC